MADIQKIADDLSSLTVLEASELNKDFRRKMGRFRSSTCSSCCTCCWTAGAGGCSAEEKTEFEIHLAACW